MFAKSTVIWKPWPIRIGRYGQLQPIVLTDGNLLVAGERRLEAIKLIGQETVERCVPCGVRRYRTAESSSSKRISGAKTSPGPRRSQPSRISTNLKQAKYGARSANGVVVEGAQAGFGLKDASAELDRSMATLSMDLQLARALKEYPRLGEEDQKRRVQTLQAHEGALTTPGTSQAQRPEPGQRDRPFSPRAHVRRRHCRTARVSVCHWPRSPSVPAPLVKKAGFKGYGILYNGDSRYVLRNLPLASVDCIITDPPYALALHGGADYTTAGKRLVEYHGGLY